MTIRLENFAGSWLVSEYVYNPDGTFVGILQQRRRMEPQADGSTRVFLSCEPRLKIENHPISAFEGEWVYEIGRDGRYRRYLGPDMLGTGLKWGPDALTGRGIWPRFGHNFTNFSLTIAPNRQIFGGRYFNAGECIANVMGVAVPELMGIENPYPAFTNPTRPADIAQTWSGTVLIFDPGYRVQAEYNMIRQFTPQGWMDQVEGGTQTQFIMDEAYDRLLISGSGVGVAKRYGWCIETSTIDTPSENGQHTLGGEVWQRDSIDVLDAASKTLIGFTQSYVDGLFAQINIFKLKPNTI
ncbi:MAG: hypothetical protein KF716_14410 [Anaerolineae bacterium]|nr:hypothetical protein [Anaerolineae bacterium]